MEADEETDVENLLLPPDDVRRRMIRLGLCGEEKHSAMMSRYYVQCILKAWNVLVRDFYSIYLKTN